MKKIIAFSSDHGGYELKEILKKFVSSKGFELVDLGPNNGTESVSYAAYGNKLAEYVLDNKDVVGIGICGTGLGISYALNRHKGIRAARVVDVNDAYLAKLHNNANVLALGGRFIEPNIAEEIFTKFMETKFEGGRHNIRIEELDK